MYHILLYYVFLYDILLHHILLYCIFPYDVLLYYIRLHDILLYHIRLHYILHGRRIRDLYLRAFTHLRCSRDFYLQAFPHLRCSRDLYFRSRFYRWYLLYRRFNDSRCTFLHCSAMTCCTILDRRCCIRHGLRVRCMNRLSPCYIARLYTVQIRSHVCFRLCFASLYTECHSACLQLDGPVYSRCRRNSTVQRIRYTHIRCPRIQCTHRRSLRFDMRGRRLHLRRLDTVHRIRIFIQ